MKLQCGTLNITPEVANRLDEYGYTPETLQAAIAKHKLNGNDNPAIYISTYGKYDNGSLCGLWIDLSTFNNYKEFLTFCFAIHADEEEPELMVQCSEGVPLEWCNNLPLKDLFDKTLRYSELCQAYCAEAVNDFLEYIDDLEKFEEAYCGQWESEEDFAYDFVNESFGLNDKLGTLACYFDYDALARDLFMVNYKMGSNGYVFRDC